MIEFTEWAREILSRAGEAARRLNPDAHVRLASVGGGMRAELSDTRAETDDAIDFGGSEIWIDPDLDGLVDVQEPHDRLVLRPHGSAPNPREH